MSLSSLAPSLGGKTTILFRIAASFAALSDFSLFVLLLFGAMAVTARGVGGTGEAGGDGRRVELGSLSTFGEAESSGGFWRLKTQ